MTVTKTRKGVELIKAKVNLYVRFQYRLLTSSKRVLPDFIVIGGQKCGTTSLHRYIKHHPNIVPPFKKDSSFFDANYSRGLRWYQAHFPLRNKMDQLSAGGKYHVTGEVTTTYIFHPLAAERAAKHLSQVKLVALLRNPAIRAYSQYQHMKRTGREKLSFRDAIEKEDERLDGVMERVKRGNDEAHMALRNFGYKARGRYAEQLKRWFKYFPRDNFLILKSEELFSQPEQVCKQAYDFWGLPDFKLDKYENVNPGRYSDADSQIIKELEEYFSPYNRELYELMGINFGW
jgi:CRISPR/Cas system-associated endonuclease/helicase Cas3